jgi:hypothetical protein
LTDVMAALRACGGDVRFELKKHRYWVYRGGLTSRELPKGKGKGGTNPQIEFGHVSKVCRTLGIDLGCVEKQLGCAR